MAKKSFVSVLCMLLALLCCCSLSACVVAEDPNACKHVYTEIKTLERSAECMPIVKQKTCNDCGDLLEQSTEASPTPCEGEWETVEPATLTQEGLRQKKCKYCEKVLESEPLEKLTETDTGGSQPGTSGGLINDRLDINGKLKDELPSTLNYGHEQISVLYWSDAERPEFEQETVTGDNVRDAIYDRNIQIEDRLNVTLKWVGVPGDGGERKNFVAHVDAVYRADTQDYDIIASYSRTQATLAVQGYLQDLSRIQQSYLDFEKPWWPKNMVDTVSFGDAYYFLTGDISTNYNYMMHVVYLNKDLFSQFQLELPYQAVRAGSWTIDKMITLSTGCYRDADNGLTQTVKDYYGLQSLDYIATSLYIGAGFRYIETDARNMFRVSDDFASQEAMMLINKLGTWAVTNDVWIHNSTTDPTGIDGRSEYQNATRHGRSLMSIQHFTMGAYYASSDWSAGIVPLPKASEGQTSYRTAMGNPYTVYGIFVDFDDRGNKQETLSMLSAVLECWASEGYRLTNPEVFEVNLQMKYSIGQDETDMYTLACESVALDLGQMLASDLNNMVELPAKAFTTETHWDEVRDDYQQTIEECLSSIVQNYLLYQEYRK